MKFETLRRDRKSQTSEPCNFFKARTSGDDTESNASTGVLLLEQTREKKCVTTKLVRLYH